MSEQFPKTSTLVNQFQSQSQSESNPHSIDSHATQTHSHDDPHTNDSQTQTNSQSHSHHDHTHSEQIPTPPTDLWKHTGVRVVPSNSLDSNTAQTPGMTRATAISLARVGAQKLWAGTVTIHANAKTGAHHHGHLESVIYVLKGKARMRWGEKLEFVAEAGPGDFIFVPPYVPHQEINALEDQELECILMRSDGEAIAINLPDLEPVEVPEGVAWIDPTHANLPTQGK